MTGIQEVRLLGQGIVGLCSIYYSGYIKERKFGVGFMVGEKLCRRILAFTPVDERLATIRIRTKLRPCPNGREYCCDHGSLLCAPDAYINEHCPTNMSKPPGRTKKVSSARLKIQQATWLSPDRKTHNHINQVVMDGRHVSSVLDMLTFRLGSLSKLDPRPDEWLYELLFISYQKYNRKVAIGKCWVLFRAGL